MPGCLGLSPGRFTLRVRRRALIWADSGSGGPAGRREGRHGGAAPESTTMLLVRPGVSVATSTERRTLAVDSLNGQMAVTTTGRTTTGKYVSRAAATGPSRSHRGKTPANWSIALVVILALGLASVAFSRYEYARSTAVAKPTTWYAGLSLVRCGVQQPALPASSAGDGVTTPGSGVLAVSLRDKSQATLGRFVDHYPGLVVGSTAFRYPGTAELRNGDRCPRGNAGRRQGGRGSASSPGPTSRRAPGTRLPIRRPWR